MALSVKVGTVAARTTTGSQAYTGIGFTPKALILFVTNRSITGVTTSINQIGYGFSSASASRAVAITSRNGGTTTANIDEESRMAAAAITMLNTFGSLHLEATLTSFDSDGFTLNFTTVTGSANLIGYIALGGTDITNVAVGDFLTGTSTGDVDVTAPGFLPDATFLMHTNLGTALPYTSRTGSRFGFGVGVSATERWASMRMVRDQILNTSAHSKQVDTAVLLGMDTSGAEDFVGDYSGPITGGFRVNLSDAPASTVRVAYLAIEGPTFSAGLETQPTSAGTKGTTVAGTPKAALFLAAAKTAGSTLDTATDAQTFIGAADGTNEVSIGGRTADNVATADVYCELDAAKAIVKSSISGTTLAECDATFSAGTVTLDWTTADAVATEFGYLTAADAAAGQTVVIGQPSETDTAQQIAKAKLKALGQGATTDAAQAITTRKALTLGQVADSSAAQPFAYLKARAIGQVSDTSTAQALVTAKMRAIGQVGETDSALVVAWSPKRRLVGQAVEVSYAQVFAIVGGAPPSNAGIGLLRISAGSAGIGVGRASASSAGIGGTRGTPATTGTGAGRT